MVDLFLIFPGCKAAPNHIHIHTHTWSLPSKRCCPHSPADKHVARCCCCCCCACSLAPRFNWLRKVTSTACRASEGAAWACASPLLLPPPLPWWWWSLSAPTPPPPPAGCTSTHSGGSEDDNRECIKRASAEQAGWDGFQETLVLHHPTNHPPTDALHEGVVLQRGRLEEGHRAVQAQDAHLPAPAVPDHAGLDVHVCVKWCRLSL